MTKGAGRALFRFSACISLVSGVALGLSIAASAVDVMLVYNSGDAASDTPGRFRPNVLPLTQTDETYPADDHQCMQSQQAATLTPLEIYIARGDEIEPEPVTGACGTAGTGDGVCGFDLEIYVNNATRDASSSFLIDGFSPDAGNGYTQADFLEDDQLTLRVNGVKTDSGHTLPVHVGTVNLRRGSIPGSTYTNCTAACETNLCATVDVTKAHIVKANLEMENLYDTVKLLRLPEPDADTMWCAGAVLTVALAGRRRRALLPVGR